MNFDKYIERMKEVEESQRKDNFLISVQKLVVEQHNANEILKGQCSALQKRNDMLEIELKNSNRNTHKALIFNIITSSIAFASLVATILIGILK